MSEPVLFAGKGESEIGHDGTHQEVIPELSLFLERFGADDQDLIAGYFLSLLVNGNEAVPVSVEGQSDSGTGFKHQLPQVSGMLGTAVFIYVKAVGLVMDDPDIGPQFGKCFRGYRIGCAVGNIHGDFHPFHGQTAGKGIFQKYNIPPVDIIETVGMAHVFGRWHQIGKCPAQNELFDFLFLRVREFKAVSGKYLNAVVLIGVV